jgi:putative transposase
MARPLRIEYPGAVYHLTSRGNSRKNIFLSDLDRLHFFNTFDFVCNKYKWKCHAYCLMTNHYHLLVETIDANLSQGMRYLNSVYSQKFNRNNDHVGHVFQGRFKGILVEKESYLLELCRYIVLNPMRACLVSRVNDWPWSSYNATAGLKPKDGFLTVDWVLSHFSEELFDAQKLYREFVALGVSKSSPWDSLTNQIILGSDEFVNANLPIVNEKEKQLSEAPNQHYELNQTKQPLNYYVKHAMNRNDAILQAWNSGEHTQKDIAEYFLLHNSRVSKIIKQAKSKA